MSSSRYVLKKSVSHVFTAEGGDVCGIVIVRAVAVVDVCVAQIVMESCVESSTESANNFPGSVDGARCVLSVGVPQRLCNHNSIE